MENFIVLRQPVTIFVTAFTNPYNLTVVLRPVLTVASVWNTGETGDINTLNVDSLKLKMPCYIILKSIGSTQNIFYKEWSGVN